jgi:hypothetical protein
VASTNHPKVGMRRVSIMAAVIGYITGNRGMASRTGSKDSGITARLETWGGAITVHLDADGTYHVRESADEKHGCGTIVHEGKVGA